MTYDGRFTIGGSNLSVVVGVVGIDEAARKLNGLENKLRGTIMADSMREALKVYRGGLVARIAPLHKTGRLKRSIRRRVKKVAGGRDIEGRVSIGNKVGGRWAFYAKWLEEGSGLYGKRHRAYELEAKHAKALMFAGAAHPFARAKIRGVKAYRFTATTARAETPRATDAFARKLDSDVMTYWNSRGGA